ncbi:unnamed protein product [Hymenolepis diminuta]|uniref:PH domain-containing protein n=1 Tax=Hymenolepis diminuta TaxID=6216 RepID=A0A0R3SXK4_HYMDI|nr:unnamed protein product [Hymenolepis diminuta]
MSTFAGISGLAGIDAQIMLSMKEGFLLWALNKDATLAQKTYGVLLPQLLLLYDTEEESRTNSAKPVKYFDLQQCLAIHPTDHCPDFYGIILMVVPGGVGLIGCMSEAERREWMRYLNEALDTEAVSSELREFIEIIRGHRDGPINFTIGFLRKGGDDNDQYYQTPTSLFTDYKLNSPLSTNIAQVISPIIVSQGFNNIMVSSCPPVDLVDSPILESPIDISSFEEMKVTNMLDRIHPTIFDKTNDKNAKKEPKEPIVEETVMDGFLEEPPQITDRPMSEGEKIIDNVRSLSKMLVSQEAAKAILAESCDKIKETLGALYDRLRIKGIQLEPGLHQSTSPIQDISRSLNDFENIDVSSVIRRNGHRPRQPGQTNSLILPGEVDTESFTLVGSSSYFGSGASSIQTLVGPEAKNPTTLPNANHQLPCCSHCLKTFASGILEIAMNLVTSQAFPTPQAIYRVRNLTSYLHSYLYNHIKSIRNRTNLPSDILVTGLAKLALTDRKSPMIVQALIENASAEVCGQILEEIGLPEDTKEENSTHLVNGMVKDWFNSIPEKADIEWMLPGYIASCLMLYRLMESADNKVKECDKPLEEPMTNGNSPNNQIEDILEALSITLIHAVCQANNDNCINNDIPIKLSQKFESIFFELLMKKWDRNVLEIIIPDIADCRTMNPDKLFLSEFKSPNDTTTLEELGSSFTCHNEGDTPIIKQKNLTQCMDNIRDELEDLSTHVLKNRQAFYESVQEKQDKGNAEEVELEAKDYATIIAALKREHEEEKLRLLQDVKQNWLQLKNLHSQINRICADIVNKGEYNGTSSHSPAAKLAKVQEIIRDR